MKPTVTPWKGAARFSTAARRCNGPNVAPKAMIWVLAGPGWIHRSARLKALTLLRRREGAVMLRTDAELGVGPGGLSLRLGGGRGRPPRPGRGGGGRAMVLFPPPGRRPSSICELPLSAEAPTSVLSK